MPSFCRLPATVWVLAAVFAVVRANSMGAPTCVPDRSAPGIPHKNTGYEERSMEDGRITITVGGQEAVVGKPIVLVVGEDYEVVISKVTDFRGYMGRISGGDSDIDTKAVFTLKPGEPDLQQNSLCDFNTGGLTHTNARPKRMISFNITVDEPSVNMKWDVNLVEVRNVQLSRFYYDQFTVHALAPGDTVPPTPAPTPQPTLVPTVVTEPSSAVTHDRQPTSRTVVWGMTLLTVMGAWSSL